MGSLVFVHMGGVICFLLVYFRKVLIARVQVFPGPWKVDMILHFSFRVLALLCWPLFGLYGLGTIHMGGIGSLLFLISTFNSSHLSFTI